MSWCISGLPYSPGCTLRCVAACDIRHLENRALPALVVTWLSTASSASSALYSVATVVRSWPNLHPGAVQGRGSSSPGSGLCDQMQRSSNVGRWHCLSVSYISPTVSGFLGVWRSAKSREQQHQPELVRCSVCLHMEG
eukprot:5882746-Prymnesium_polylepis.1